MNCTSARPALAVAMREVEASGGALLQAPIIPDPAPTRLCAGVPTAQRYWLRLAEPER